jgi:hypothetical protein
MGSPMDTTLDFQDQAHQTAQALPISCQGGADFDDDMMGMLDQVASILLHSYTHSYPVAANHRQRAAVG